MSEAPPASEAELPPTGICWTLLLREQERQERERESLPLKATPQQTTQEKLDELLRLLRRLPPEHRRKVIQAVRERAARNP